MPIYSFMEKICNINFIRGRSFTTMKNCISYTHRKRMTQHHLIPNYMPSAVACTKIK